MIKRLFDGTTAGGFFPTSLDLHLDETGALIEFSAPHPGDEIPRATSLTIAQARELAAALTAGADLAENLATASCSGCSGPSLSEELCVVCELEQNRSRRALLHLVK